MKKNGLGISDEGYVVEDRPEGRTLVVTGRWSSATANGLASSGADGLELNYARGYREPDLDFLEAWPIRRLLVLDRNLRDLGPLHRFTSLEELRLETGRGAQVDLALLPHVRVLAADWNHVRESLSAGLSLQDVSIWSYDGQDLRPFSALNEMRTLMLVDARRLQDLAGLEDLRKFVGLRVSGSPLIRDVNALSPLADRLLELEFERCPGIAALSGIESLAQLQFVGINDCRDIDSLGPVGGLRRLEVLHAWGDTRIIDDDLTPVAGLPRLRELRMRDRRSYRPRVAELQDQISARQLD